MNRLGLLGFLGFLGCLKSTPVSGRLPRAPRRTGVHAEGGLP